jgi:CHAT domain-containing protein
VVLSACNTAAPDGSGAEAISGLGRAFLYAGARALLVTHWPVETTSARALTTTLFRLWSGTPAPAQAEALRRAMMVLVDEQGYRDTMGRMVFSYAHPVFWAPFAMIGDGGRGGVPRVAERIASAE